MKLFCTRESMQNPHENTYEHTDLHDVSHLHVIPLSAISSFRFIRRCRACGCERSTAALRGTPV